MFAAGIGPLTFPNLAHFSWKIGAYFAVASAARPAFPHPSGFQGKVTLKTLL
jgi:hypothetical protein